MAYQFTLPAGPGMGIPYRVLGAQPLAGTRHKALVGEAYEEARNEYGVVCDITRASHVLRRALRGIRGPVAEGVLKQAQDELYTTIITRTPALTGFLREHVFVQADMMSNRLTAGTRGVEYAMYVHEGVHPPKYRSDGAVINYTTAGTDWKFIEIPVRQFRQRRLAGLVEEHVQRYNMGA